MSLSKPKPRKAYHNRKIQCAGFARDDGLWDIEGNMIDEKCYDFYSESRGQVKSGDPVHDMWMRLTLDDEFMIHEIEVKSAAHPYPICPEVEHRYQNLVGLMVGPGFRKGVYAKLKSLHGCTHITELLWSLATVAYQTIYGSAQKRRQDLGLADPNMSVEKGYEVFEREQKSANVAKDSAGNGDDKVDSGIDDENTSIVDGNGDDKVDSGIDDENTSIVDGNGDGGNASVITGNGDAGKDTGYNNTDNDVVVDGKEDVKKRPRQLNSCHAMRTDLSVVKRFWPQYYDGE